MKNTSASSRAAGWGFSSMMQPDHVIYEVYLHHGLDIKNILL